MYCPDGTVPQYCKAPACSFSAILPDHAGDCFAPDHAGRQPFQFAHPRDGTTFRVLYWLTAIVDRGECSSGASGGANSRRDGMKPAIPGPVGLQTSHFWQAGDGAAEDAQRQT